MAKKRTAKPNKARKSNNSNNNTKTPPSSTTKTPVGEALGGVGFGGNDSSATANLNTGNTTSKSSASRKNKVNTTTGAGADDEEGPYIPRGPTLREEYERRGIIEPLEMDRDAGTLPETVANRMIRRIVTFGGTPLLLLFTFFALYFVLKYKYDITVLPVVVASSTLGSVGLATAGITYGILSSSWDEDDEGSALGWKEFKVNFMRAKDGVASAVAREKQEDELDRIDQLADAMEKEDKVKEQADKPDDDDKTS